MKSIVALALMAVLVPGVWAAAPEAVLQSLKGKVEVKAPGTTAWVAATEGQTLSPAVTLSTGFDSSVVVVIGKTTIQVKPLTRMTIDKLVEEGGAVKTSTFLRVGNVSASVKSADGVKQDFKVQSPFSTASVRGTEFDYDGIKLAVKEGLVALALGRSPRESQPVAGSTASPATPAEGAATAGTPAATPAAPVIDHSSDYVGAPDITADTTKAVAVAAGTDAKVVVNYQNPTTPTTSSSTDLSSLQKSSGQSTATPVVPASPPATKGSVTLTIQFGS